MMRSNRRGVQTTRRIPTNQQQQTLSDSSNISVPASSNPSHTIGNNHRRLFTYLKTSQTAFTNNNNNKNKASLTTMMTESTSNSSCLPILAAEPIAEGSSSSKTRRSTRSSSSSFCFLPILYRWLKHFKVLIAVLIVLSRILWYFYWMHWEGLSFENNSRMLDVPTWRRSSSLQQQQQYDSSSSGQRAQSKQQQSIEEETHSIMENMDPWTQEDTFEIQQQLTVRRLERQKRTRPPPANSMIAPRKSLLHKVDLWTNTTLRMDADSTTTTTTTNQQRHDWKTLCQKAGLSSKSRVVITGVFSSSSSISIGPALALLLSKQCRVSNIAGVDALFPNLRRVRMAAMNTYYRVLYRSIDNFVLIVPTASAGLARRVMDDKTKNKSTRTVELEWLHTFQPTHIIHMETSSHDDDDVDGGILNEIMEPVSQRLYRVKNAAMAMEQLLNYCRQRPRAPVSLLHIVSTETSLKRGSSSSSNNTAPIVIQQLAQLLIETYLHTVTPKLKSPMHILELPAVFGPLIHHRQQQQQQQQPPQNGVGLFVDDAVAAVLKALQKGRSGLHRMTVVVKDTTAAKSSLLLSNTTTFSQDASSVTTIDEVGEDGEKNKTLFTDEADLQQTVAYATDREFPYGMPPQGRSMAFSPEIMHSAASQYRQTYGIHQTRFPCASSCGNGPTSLTCESSVFDNVIPISLEVTSKCSYVVYLVDYANDLEELFVPAQPDAGNYLCRLAFVSDQSPIVQEAIAKKMKSSKNSDERSISSGTMTSNLTDSESLNGKLTLNGWTLIWVHGDEYTLTDAEFALVRMEPSRFFASSVIKAMFTATQEFAEPPDYVLYRIFSRLDRPPLPRHMRKEQRSGIKVTRFVEHPAEKARHIAFFASEPPREYLPQNIAEYAKLAQNASSVSIPRRQLNFYKQTSHWVQTDLYRPLEEIRSTIYVPFPFQWVSMGLFVHDMKMEEARTFRCSWYDEHLYWGHSNRGADELSLAYLIGKRRIEGSVGPEIDDDASWYPLMKQDNNNERHLNRRGAEVYLRIMRTRGEL